MTRTVTCQKAGVAVDAAMCDANHDTKTSEACNVDACPVYKWLQNDWSACSRDCGGGTRDAIFVCSSSAGGLVPESSCTEPKPTKSEACNAASCDTDFVWEVTSVGPCSKACGTGTVLRTIECKQISTNMVVQNDDCDPATKPATNVLCSGTECTAGGVWWNCPWEACTATCGGTSGGMAALKHRNVLCKDSFGNVIDPLLCNQAQKPVTFEACNPQPCLDFNWMADGPWSACENGQRTNDYHCHAADGSNAQDLDCGDAIGAKPPTTQVCALNQCPKVGDAPECQTHTTKQSQTLGEIAAAWDTTVGDIVQLNPGKFTSDAESHVPADGVTVMIPGDCVAPIKGADTKVGSTGYRPQAAFLLVLAAALAV